MTCVRWCSRGTLGTFLISLCIAPSCVVVGETIRSVIQGNNIPFVILIVLIPRAGVWYVLLYTLPGVLGGNMLARVLCLNRRPIADGIPRCLKCNYALLGLVESRCPECGTPF